MISGVSFDIFIRNTGRAFKYKSDYNVNEYNAVFSNVEIHINRADSLLDQE